MTEMPTREQEQEEIVQDARSERHLVWKAAVAVAVVVVIVVVRELVLR